MLWPMDFLSFGASLGGGKNQAGLADDSVCVRARAPIANWPATGVLFHVLACGSSLLACSVPVCVCVHVSVWGNAILKRKTCMGLWAACIEKGGGCPQMSPCTGRWVERGLLSPARCPCLGQSLSGVCVYVTSVPARPCRSAGRTRCCRLPGCAWP